MTPHEAYIWNKAIESAVKSYPYGIGAIQSLKRTYTITVEHIGRSTKQEVTVNETDCGIDDGA